MRYLYLMQCEKYYKVGIATNPKQRQADLQTGNPFPIKLLSAWPYTDPTTLERVVHILLSADRVRGEWFELSDNTLEFVIGLLSGNPVFRQHFLPDDALADNSFEEVLSEEDLLLVEVLSAPPVEPPRFDNTSWRLERRRDGHAGYAIYRRGKAREYLGYLPAAMMADPNNPTTLEVQKVLSGR